jgi:glycosyltransferase involved in cell wall biosynthesis
LAAIQFEPRVPIDRRLLEGQVLRMKIAHVVDSMEVGGAETLVMQMCRLQREQGHDPCVYAIAALGPLGEQLRKEGFNVQANLGGHMPDSARNLFHLFKETRPDVAHLHNPTPTYYAAPAARVAGVPSIVSTRHNLAAPPRRLAAEIKYGVALACCDWVVGICDATVANLRKMHIAPTRKIVRVYNGAVAMRRVEQQACPPRSGFTLVFVGRLAPVKNHTLLLSAFQIALASIPGLRLWMVGDGSERPELEQMAGSLGISSQVTFWGEQLDVAPYFSAADAFIMSSRSEGLPVSLLQAFSLGLPTIVTDVGGMAEAVRLAKAGYVVPANNPAAMAEAILRMARSEVERKQFSTGAEGAFLSHFTLESMVEAYADLYRGQGHANRLASSG